MCSLPGEKGSKLPQRLWAAFQGPGGHHQGEGRRSPQGSGIRKSPQMRTTHQCASLGAGAKGQPASSPKNRGGQPLPFHLSRTFKQGLVLDVTKLLNLITTLGYLRRVHHLLNTPWTAGID